VNWIWTGKYPWKAGRSYQDPTVSHTRKQQFLQCPPRETKTGLWIICLGFAIDRCRWRIVISLVVNWGLYLWPGDVRVVYTGRLESWSLAPIWPQGPDYCPLTGH